MEGNKRSKTKKKNIIESYFDEEKIADYISKLNSFYLSRSIKKNMIMM